MQKVKVMVEKINWKFVRVPASLHKLLKRRAVKEKKAIWKVILSSVAYRDEVTKRHHASVSDLDRKAWYIYKLISSLGVFRELPNNITVDYVMRNCNQIEKRLGVDASTLKEVVKAYLNRPSRQNRIALNETAKIVIKNIIVS